MLRGLVDAVGREKRRRREQSGLDDEGELPVLPAPVGRRAFLDRRPRARSPPGRRNVGGHVIRDVDGVVAIPPRAEMDAVVLDRWTVARCGIARVAEGVVDDPGVKIVQNDVGVSPSGAEKLPRAWAAQGCEILNFQGSYLGQFLLVSAHFWTGDHLSSSSRRVYAFSDTFDRQKLQLKYN